MSNPWDDQMADADAIGFADRGIQVTYLPQGGMGFELLLYAFIGHALDESLEPEERKMDTRTIHIRATDRPYPKSVAKDGEGDRVVLPGDARTWYVRRTLQEGKVSGTGLHVLLIADSLAPLSL